jgi:hypothetical protein
MAANKIDPEKQYRVKLSKVVEIAPDIYARPNDQVVLKGKVLATIIDDVEVYEPVDADKSE